MMNIESFVLGIFKKCFALWDGGYLGGNFNGRMFLEYKIKVDLMIKLKS